MQVSFNIDGSSHQIEGLLVINVAFITADIERAYQTQESGVTGWCSDLYILSELIPCDDHDDDDYDDHLMLYMYCMMSPIPTQMCLYFVTKTFCIWRFFTKI